MMSILKYMATLAAVLVVAACGGGGSGAGSSPFGSGSGGGTGGGTGGGGTPGQPTIALTLSTATVTAAAPATVTALVKDATGVPAAGQVVQFGTTGGLGKLSSSSALTDASGSASVSLQPATVATTGADQVTASTVVNGTTVLATAGFQLTATQVTIANFASDVSVLAAYGQATITATLAGTTATSPVNVVVSSGCVAKGKASLTPASATTSTGVATFTYRDAGCGATDLTDTISASVTGTVATASVQLTLTSPQVSSITFSSATPPTIYLKGSGLNETSQVIFQVRDTAGNGLPGQSVQLEMVSAAGGVTLDSGLVPVTKLSDSLGNVVARINSGTVPTAVRVKATLVAGGISTVSSNLSVAVGLPAQLNFSLAQGTRNIEGFNIDGTPNTYSIIASDRLGNPVPDGTAINFVTEGGQVEAIKFTGTVNGLARATANFLSAEPRPRDGRVTVLAYALGEESFLDVNGTNVYELSAGEPFMELGDVYLDRAFNGVYDAAVDQFISLSPSGSSACAVSSSPLLLLDRSMPSRPNTCNAEWGRTYVRRATETVLSTSAARPVWGGKRADQFVPTGSSCAKVTLKDVLPPNFYDVADFDFYPVQGSDLYNLGGLGTIFFYVSDANDVRLNPMAAGTTVSVAGTDGLTLTVSGGSPVPSTLYATGGSVNYKFEPASGGSGTVTLTIRSPGGLGTAIPFRINSGAPPAGHIACP